MFEMRHYKEIAWHQLRREKEADNILEVVEFS